MAKAIDADQRYLYSFNPQITHGPWPGLTSSSTREETCRAGFPLFREVDGMVGELVSLLRNKHRLDKTLILVLGDHGLRTRREYPPFHGGTLDDVTFHVPLVLYAPGVVSSTERIPWMTSHIDIAPSVLDLLGIETDRDLELGSPMWERALADRATFFFAKGYLGADGYQRSNEAVMVRYLYGGVSRAEWNGTLSFQATDLLRQPDAELLRTVDDLTMMAAIQTELARTMLPSVRRLSRPAERRDSGLVHRVSSGGATPPRSAPRKR
jgi:arylsulfatase A-like enzyme